MVTRTKKIFVGGVSASTTEEDLTNYFKTFGSVSTKYDYHINKKINITTTTVNTVFL